MMNNVSKNDRNQGGIYKITNIKNQKMYIGSAMVFDNRYRQHKCLLQKGEHDNEHLQRAYKKYGPNSFVFESIEIVDGSCLVAREQYFLSKAASVPKQYYNMNFDVNPRSLNKRHRRDYLLIDPQNTLKYFSNHLLSEVVRTINQEQQSSVSVGGLHHVIRGRHKSHKGWRLPENCLYDYRSWRKQQVRRKFKTYNVRLLSPSGDIHGPITNLNAFCKEHGIENPAGILNLIKGRTRYINGWSLFEGSTEKPRVKNSKVYAVKLKSPSGDIHGPITNLNAFCKEHSLNSGQMRRVINGKHKSNHRGWVMI